MISQAFAGVEVAGQTLALCSPITTKPRGIKNPLQTASFAAGSLTRHALVDLERSILLEQTADFTSPTTAYPPGMVEASASAPFHQTKPLQTVSTGPGFLMNQAFV